MCAIAGCVGTSNKRFVSRSLELLTHRGKDDRALFSYKNSSIGMNRLAIHDLRKDIYPIRYKKLVLVYNGEIYNYSRLKQDPALISLKFSTHSDAEVILPLYDAYSTRAFEMFDGMFALCILDTQSGKIILARDRSGEKPLYYSHQPSGFYFASEMKALLVNAHGHIRLNKTTLPQYFIDGFVHAPDTIVESVTKVPCGSFIEFNPAKSELIQGNYIQKTQHRVSKNDTSIIENSSSLDTALKESVRAQLSSDVPVGCFLSGGVDSGLIASYASMSQKDLHTFSIAFPEYPKYSESAQSAAIALHIKSDHAQINCKAKDVVEMINKLGTFIDEPIVDPAVLPTLLLSKSAREHVKVVLTGDGADELFGGYSRYKIGLFTDKVYNVFTAHKGVQAVRNMLFPGRFSRIFQPLIESYSPQNIWTREELHRLIKIPIPETIHTGRRLGNLSALQFMQESDLAGYMPEQLLNKVDKATMHYTIEARAPYLSSRVIEIARSIPDDQKLRHGHGKYILKLVAEKYIPESLIWRPKHGFDLPLREWFCNELSGAILKSVEQLSEYQSIFSLEYYIQIITDHIARRKNYSNKIWSMMVLGSWLTHNHIEV